MKRILVIEDSKTINRIITKELANLGFLTDSATTFAEAKSLLETNRYDLIILDLHLPDGEGSELIAHIQSLTKTKVVVLTSRQDDGLREELFQFGILDYIVKDTNLLYSVAEVVRVIDSVAHRQNDRILIIDDSEFVCKQIRTILEPRNYTVIAANSAQEAMERLKGDTFDLIVLDMELPDIHGTELLLTIRKDIRYLDIPVIVLSGTATPQIVRDVLKNGASDYLKKPFVAEEFVLKIDLWIDYFKKSRALEQKTHQLQFLNENLERLVYEEVQKNREKDKLMFQQYRQAQMGEMIAMIAHQWRQPLNAISAAVSLINLRVQRGKFDLQTSKEITAKINKYLQHLSSTIDDFRDFFKPQKERRVTDFEIIVSKAFTLIEDTFARSGVELSVQIERVESFLTYENELVQVVISLLKNAEEILLERRVRQPTVWVRVAGRRLEVEDNGGGVPDNIVDKIFDPYFSTKEKRQGTGLGLYMSKMIVEEHCHGKLSVHNTQNGACFVIELPSGDRE